jgi:uncharacterized membrane protein YhhN
MKNEIPSGAGVFAVLALGASILSGASYLFGMNLDLNSTVMLAWKGAGVWFLAVYCALLAKSIDGWLITVVMALGAAGDVLLETDMVRGGAAFAASHVVAMALYARNRRSTLTRSQMLVGILVVPVSVFLAWILPSDRDGVAIIVTYGLFISIMAAMAWTSRFPRYRTGIGAMMCLASDLLIFGRMGPLAEAGWVTLAVWTLYFAGQVLIVLGVTKTLSGKKGGFR